MAKCAGNNRNQLEACRRLAGGASGSNRLPPNVFEALRAPLTRGGDPLKRKLPRTETETNNNKAAKKAKANENARQAAINAQLKGVANVAKRLRLEFLVEQMRRTPPAGKTWTRNNSGKITVTNNKYWSNLEQREANLQKYLNYFNRYMSGTHGSENSRRILNNARNLRTKLGLAGKNREEVFHYNSTKNATDQLVNIKKKIIKRLQEK
jgi:hypothetical protein